MMELKCPLHILEEEEEGGGVYKLEWVCLHEVEITFFFEGSRQENANQIKKKSQALWEFRAEWGDGERERE